MIKVNLLSYDELISYKGNKIFYYLRFESIKFLKTFYFTDYTLFNYDRINL